MSLERILAVPLLMCLLGCDAGVPAIGAATPREGSAPGVVAIGMSASAFVQHAADAGRLQIEASRLAQGLAGTPEVRIFAAMMIEDYARIATELRYAAGPHPIREDLGAREQALLAVLRIHNGLAFDQLYVAEVALDAHDDTVRLFERYARQGPDGKLKQFALVTLPKLKGYLEQGRRLAASKSAALRVPMLRGTNA